MKSNKLERAINSFKNDYKTYVEDASYEVRVSQLSKEEQAEFWRRDAELHPSSFPFCGLRAAYERFQRAEDPVLKKDFGADYFLPVGTATHSGLQKWMGHSKKIIGDWHCTNPECAKIYAFQIEPKKCKCGNKQKLRFRYEELGGKWGKHTSWHTDGVYEKTEGQYWVLDYKTTSEYAIEKHRKEKNVFPYISNRFQIETYVPLIESTYNIKIQGWLLDYVARDNPKKTWKTEVVGGTLNAERREQLMERLKQADTDFGRVLKVRTSPKKVFAILTETKLCPDKDFYEHFVRDEWDECPLSKKGLCWKANKLKAHLQETIDAGPGK